MSAVQILIYVLLIYLIIRSFMNQRKYNRIKGINECLDVIEDEEQFFPKIDAYIAQAKEEEMVSRAEVIKLYGIIIHKKYDEFEEVLDKINIDSFILNKQGKPSIEEEEVSFFYLYLVFPILLWGDDKNDLREKINSKLEPYAEQFDLQLVKRIGDSFNAFFDQKDDRGKAFDQKIMDGDYADYYYAKALIGLYKDLVNAVLAKIYKDEGEEAKYQDCAELVQSFGETNIGKRLETALGIYQEKKEEADESEEHTGTEVSEKK